MDLGDKLLPVKSTLGTTMPLLDDIAHQTGLPRKIPVACGLHDSNASLFKHLQNRHQAFTVVSTGTWVVAMAIKGHPVRLDPEQDCLINVNVYGDPVPCA